MFKTTAVFLIYFFVSLNSFAQMFVLDDTSIQSPAVTRFFNDIEQRLPEKMKSEIANKIHVRFSKLGKSSNLVPPCNAEDNEKAKIEGLPVYATHLLMSSAKNLKIELNQLFLDVINTGPAKAVQYNCGHKNLYLLAQASVMHEVAHIFDLRTGLKFNPEFQTIYDNNMVRCSDASNNQVFCNYYKRIKGRISDAKDYLDLINWAYEDGTIKRKETTLFRSPDPYEGASQYEHFAVNFEYYMLDPEYACRRPTLYNYYSRTLSHTPFPDYSCQVKTEALYSFAPQKLDLNPDRIYQVHYLLAGKGKDLAGKFGHTMLRIIGCAPNTPVGPKCLSDINYHYVVSYRMNSLDVIQNNLKAVTGGYPSQTFLYPLVDIISEYSMHEGRDLMSYPLKMDRSQISTLVYRVLEMYWQYSGNYYFLSNNCATEAKNILQAIYPNKDLSSLGVISPYGMVDILKRENLLVGMDSSQQYQGIYYFPAFRAQMTKLFDRLNSELALNPAISFKQFEKSKTAERRIYKEELEKKFPAKLDLIGSIWIGMEFLFKEKELNDLKTKQVELLTNAQKQTKNEISELAMKNKAALVLIQPWKLTTQGYGIPFGKDKIADEQVTQLMNDSQTYIYKINAISEKELPNDYAEAHSIVKNINDYVSLLKNTKGP